ncbi:hypothetical protein JCM11641_001513 [Rhodosporidiobolus odoratus]
MATPALAHLPPHHHHHHHISNPTNSNPSAAGSAVRLPPVTLPPANFLDSQGGFDPGRRQSINSDPFLHAFSSGQDPVNQPTAAEEHFLHAPPPPLRNIRQPATGETSATGSTLGYHGAGREVDGRTGPPRHLGGNMGAQEPYRFQPSFAPAPSPNHHSQSPSAQGFAGGVGPNSTYRFGGPSQMSTPLEGPSAYLDYSMRRHSISNNQNGAASPPRHLSVDNGIPSPALKRKPSGDADDFEDGYVQAVRYGQPASAGAPPYPKRRTSSHTYDKLTNLSLTDASRRESYMTGPGSPWEEERRTSNGSFASQGSQGYGVPAYHPVPSPYEQPQPPQQAHQPPGQPGPAWDGQQVGPRGSISRGPYDESGGYQRRPSIPSVSQMMQGQNAYYNSPSSAPPPPTSLPPQSQPSSYPSHSRGATQPSLLVSSVPHTPTEIGDGHSRNGSNASYSSIPPRHPGLPHRQNSASSLSLEPLSAFGPGMIPPGKDTPYSRTPELRESHKMAERKRRKEMAQLFEDLRDVLPFEKGLKASKWEILSKAVDYVHQLKAFTQDLQAENKSVREQCNLGPSTVQLPPNLDSAEEFLKSRPPAHTASQHQHSSSQSISPTSATPAVDGSTQQANTSASSQHSQQWSDNSRPTSGHPNSTSQASISPNTAAFPPRSQQTQQQHEYAYQLSSSHSGQSPPLAQYAGTAGSPAETHNPALADGTGAQPIDHHTGVAEQHMH